MRPFDAPAHWWTVLIVLVLVASVNLCLYFFYYAPALAGPDEVVPTTTSGELTLPTSINLPTDSS